MAMGHDSECDLFANDSTGEEEGRDGSGSGTESDASVSYVPDTPEKRRAPRKRAISASADMGSDLREVKKLLVDLCKKVDKNERCLKEIQESQRRLSKKPP